MMRAARMYTDAMITQQPDIRVEDQEVKTTWADIIGGTLALVLVIGFFFYLLPALFN